MQINVTIVAFPDYICFILHGMKIRSVYEATDTVLVIIMTIFNEKLNR